MFLLLRPRLLPPRGPVHVATVLGHFNIGPHGQRDLHTDRKKRATWHKDLRQKIDQLEQSKLEKMKDDVTSNPPEPSLPPPGITILKKAPVVNNIKFEVPGVPPLSKSLPNSGDSDLMSQLSSSPGQTLDAGTLERIKKRAGYIEPKKGFAVALPSHVVGKLVPLKITKPSMIQKTVIPYLVTGQDAIVSSQTGSGKTLAYLLPLLARIDNYEKTTQVVIMVPTRELAVQVSKLAKELGRGGSKKRKKNPVTVRRVVGKVNQMMKSTLTHHPTHVVVGTPHTLQFMLKEGILDTSRLISCVFDEVDHLLQDFSQQAALDFMKPKDGSAPWQLIFVTASVTPAVEKAAEKFMSKPYIDTRDALLVHRDAASGSLVYGESEGVTFEKRPKRTTPLERSADQGEAEEEQGDESETDEDEEEQDGEVDDHFDSPSGEGDSGEGGAGDEEVKKDRSRRAVELFQVSVPNPASRPALEDDDVVQDMPEVSHQILVGDSEEVKEKMALFRRWYNAEKPAQLLIFVRNNELATRLFKNLLGNKFSVMQLLNDTPKELRHMAIRRMARRNLRILITTDMGSRGLHFPQLTHVFNFDIPSNLLKYIHTSGRVGRLSGRRDNPSVVTLCSQDDAFSVWEYAKALQVKMQPISVQGHSIIKGQRAEGSDSV